MTHSRKPVPMTKDTPVLHMLCGKAAAGKSTLCERLVTPRTIVIAQDHWMSKLYTEELQTVADYVRLVRVSAARSARMSSTYCAPGCASSWIGRQTRSQLGHGCEASSKRRAHRTNCIFSTSRTQSVSLVYKSATQKAGTNTTS